MIRVRTGLFPIFYRKVTFFTLMVKIRKEVVTMNIFRKVAMCVLLFALILVFGLHVQCDEDIIVPDTERKEETVGNTTPPGDLVEEVSDETEDEETYSSSLVINKQLISGVWHVGCDVMGN